MELVARTADGTLWVPNKCPSWVWASSGSQWWTGWPGILQSTGLQRVGHNWVTELIWSELNECHWKSPWCWERLKVGGEGEDSRWDGWMASLTQWTWVWASSGSWWWTGRPGVLQSMGLRRIRHNWATELKWTERVSVDGVGDGVDLPGAAPCRGTWS